MSLESELHTIWQKYEPMRQAERDAAETARKAREDLIEFNRKRAEKGLPPVSEERDHSSVLESLSNHILWPAPKTWRDEMDAAILVAVKKHFYTPPTNVKETETPWHRKKAARRSPRTAPRRPPKRSGRLAKIRAPSKSKLL